MKLYLILTFLIFICMIPNTVNYTLNYTFKTRFLISRGWFIVTEIHQLLQIVRFLSNAGIVITPLPWKQPARHCSTVVCSVMVLISVSLSWTLSQIEKKNFLSSEKLQRFSINRRFVDYRENRWPFQNHPFFLPNTNTMQRVIFHVMFLRFLFSFDVFKVVCLFLVCVRISKIHISSKINWT